MAEDSKASEAITSLKTQISTSSENLIITPAEQVTTCEVPEVQNVSELREETEGELPVRLVKSRPEPENEPRTGDTASQHLDVYGIQDKENSAPHTTIAPGDDAPGQKSCGDSCKTVNKQDITTEDRDAEVLRLAREEGRVNVVFSGSVSQDGCCRFVSEILKCILYQRQQLPMTYDQLVYSQKKRQASVQDKDTVSRRPAPYAGVDSRKCQQTLQELEEVLHQLEVLFTLSKVPRVLLLMGGSLILPKELYEINMEGLVLAGGDQCLRVSSCLRQIFRTLFVADLLSDAKPVRLMPTTVLVLAHRDCGVDWFRPKLQFKVPARVKNQTIALSTDSSACNRPGPEGSDNEDYVWFQAPMTIKGFSS